MESDKKIILFDFDGVIVDSLLHYIEIFNNSRLSSSIGPLKIEDLRDLHPKEILKRVHFGGLGLPYLVRKMRSQVKKEIANYDPIEGMQEVIKEIKKYHEIGILSTNSTQNVHSFLRKHNMESFHFTVSHSGLFKKDVAIRKIISRRGASKKDLVYIGDEIRDIEAAKKVGVKSIGVTWGLNSKKALKNTGADFIAENPKQLFDIINSLK